MADLAKLRYDDETLLHLVANLIANIIVGSDTVLQYVTVIARELSASDGLRCWVMDGIKADKVDQVSQSRRGIGSQGVHIAPRTQILYNRLGDR